MTEISCCPTISLAFDVVSDVDFGHSNRYVVVSHYYFILQLSDDILCGAPFYMLLFQCTSFSSEVPIKVVGLYLN